MGWAKRWLKALLGGKKDARDRRDASSYSGGQERRDKRRRSFDRSRQASTADGDLSPAIAPEQTRLQRTCYTDNSEDNKHAIAVAVATAAAADSAVIAAHAAMTRLKCLTRGRTVTMLWAAINIQKAYRGYLARKALRALKALVKLQALIRGQIVRKQAAATLKQLEALVRVQALSLHRRSHGFPGEGSRRMHPDYFPRRSYEKASVCEARIKYSVSTQSQGSDRSTKIIEVDTCQPQSRSFHATNSLMLHRHEELKPVCSSHTYHLKLRNIRCSEDFDRPASSVKERYAKTTHNTPRLPPASPAESPRSRDDILEHLLHRADCPSYMASTRSFAAKVRSYSTAKGRPETPRLKNRLAGGRQMVEIPASLMGNATGRNLKAGAERRLDMSLDLCSEAARDYYLDTMW